VFAPEAGDGENITKITLDVKENPSSAEYLKGSLWRPGDAATCVTRGSVTRHALEKIQAGLFGQKELQVVT
jgi:hypothetical protein